MSLALKRKADDLDDSDDEEPMLGRQVLPVANLPDNFDGVPMDGLQYLFTVRCASCQFYRPYRGLADRPLGTPQTRCALSAAHYAGSQPV